MPKEKKPKKPKKPLPRIPFDYWTLKNMAIDEPEGFLWLIDKYGWGNYTWVQKHDRAKLQLIRDFLQNPEKFKNYWAKKHATMSTQLSLFDIGQLPLL